jgi:N-acetylmuramoyl-L-alanine amidase
MTGPIGGARRVTEKDVTLAVSHRVRRRSARAASTCS